MAELPSDREYPFNAQDFQRVCKLIEQYAGISLNDTKQNMVYSRLSRRIRATGASSFKDYLDALEAGNGDDWQEFVNSLTTNLTSFFRESHHFPILHERVTQHGRSPLRIWCAAASTGEEPYSIAMTVLEARGNDPKGVDILATDIDTNVLETARRGIYPADSLKTVSQEQRRRFFLKGRDQNAGKVRVRPELANMIDYKPLNLLDDAWPMKGPFDIIFCRNVMIYFEKPVQRKILSKMAKLLKPGGLYFAGHSENFTDCRDILVLRGMTVYERV